MCTSAHDFEDNLVLVPDFRPYPSRQRIFERIIHIIYTSIHRRDYRDFYIIVAQVHVEPI